MRTPIEHMWSWCAKASLLHLACAAEKLAKLACAGLASAIFERLDRHRYRLSHRLVRAGRVAACSQMLCWQGK